MRTLERYDDLRQEARAGTPDATIVSEPVAR
jgi:hypothetical protein